MTSLLITLGRALKPILSRTIYRPGSVARILFGPAKGLRYTIFPGYGLSMIYGGWEPFVHSVMQKCVTSGGVVYDLGANYGIYSMFLARLVGPTGRVYAFEPMPAIMSQLKANIALNNLTNVDFVQLAVSDRIGTAEFRVGFHAGAGHLQSADQYHPISGEVIQVEQVTLDEFVRRSNQPPTFMKIDVEGAEGAVFAGAKQVLADYRPVIIVEIHSPDLGKAVSASLLAAKYNAWRIDSGKYESLNLGSIAAGGSELMGSLLALPSERASDFASSEALIS